MTTTQTVTSNDADEAPPSPASTDSAEMAIEVLIHEARQRTSRRHRWIAVAVAAILVVAAVAYGIGGLGKSPVATQGSAHESRLIGAPATVEALGAGSAIWSIDMVSPRVGYAVAGVPSQTHDAYLVATTNGGTSWIVRSVLPYGVSTGSYTQPTLAFANASIGYTEAGNGVGVGSNPHVYVTSDAGASWHPLAFFGYPPKFASPTLLGVGPNQGFQLVGGVLSLVALQCTSTELADAANFCPSTLYRFRLGETGPFATKTIPYVQDTATRILHQHLSDRILAAVSASTVIVAEGGGSGDGESAAPSVITTNGGATWTRWRNPCDQLSFSPYAYGLPAQSLQVSAKGTWLLTCYMGSGMQQGLMYLALSRNHGATWSVVSKASQTGSSVGSLGDFDNFIWTSNDGRVMWAWSPVVMAMTFSTDAGRSWHYPAPDALGGSGRCLGCGPPGVVISAVGPKGAVLVGANGMAYRTQDGASWRSVRLLPLR